MACKYYINGLTLSKDEFLNYVKKQPLEESAKILGIKTTPSAPFVTDTNAWTKLGLKVALKEAVKQGATKIAWTTGEQQNDRYDLSKQVDKIDVEAVEEVDSLFFVDIKLSNGTTENLEVENGIIREGNYKGQRLDNVIGKDYADKILSTPKGESKTLEGADLKVGGKGMKGFYGSPTEGSLGIVGNVAKSLFKQEPNMVEIEVGRKKSAPIESITLNGESVKEKSPWASYILDYNKTGKSYTIDENKLSEILTFHKKQIDNAVYKLREVEGLINSLSIGDKVVIESTAKTPTSTQHSIDITPELKATVESGLPLFMAQNSQAYAPRPNETLSQYKDRMREEVEATLLGENADQYLDQAQAKSILEKIENWIKEFTEWITRQLGFENVTEQQLQDMTMKDILDRVTTEMLRTPAETNFDIWKGNNEMVDGSDLQDIRTGRPIVVRAYHGTTNEFYVFDSSVKGNIEGHLGKINYFTTDYQDASSNYQADGADITGRIDIRQDELDNYLFEEYFNSEEDGLDFQQIIDDFNITDEEINNLYPSGKPDFIQAEEISRFLAEKELKGGVEKVLEVFVKLNNPVVLGNGNSYIDLTDRTQFEEYLEQAAQEIAEENDISIEEAKEDYEWDIDSKAMEIAGYENPLYQALEKAISDNIFDYENAPEKTSNILSDFYESEINLYQLENRLREELLNEQNEYGNLVSSQIVADFFKNLGFDGIILTDVSKRFRNMGLSSNTSHIHVFDEFNNQIKLADGTNTTFGQTPDIRYMIIGETEVLETRVASSKDFQIKSLMDKGEITRSCKL